MSQNQITIPPPVPEETLNEEQKKLRQSMTASLSTQNNTIASLLQNIHKTVVENNTNLIAGVVSLYEENVSLKQKILDLTREITDLKKQPKEKK